VLVLLAAVLLAIRYRRRLIGLAGSGLAVASTWAQNGGLHHRTLRRRRRLTRERGTSTAVGADTRRRAYDDPFSESRGVWDRALPTGHGALPKELLSDSFEVRGRPVKPVREPSLDELPL